MASLPFTTTGAAPSGCDERRRWVGTGVPAGLERAETVDDADAGGGGGAGRIGLLVLPPVLVIDTFDGEGDSWLPPVLSVLRAAIFIVLDAAPDRLIIELLSDRSAPSEASGDMEAAVVATAPLPLPTSDATLTLSAFRPLRTVGSNAGERRAKRDENME